MLSDIGDLSTLAVDAANASIAVASKRLQKIKIGDEVAENVTSNLASINIGECPSLMLVDARNLASLSGTIDLTQCPRLREAYFGGTDVRAITLANGSKLTKLQLPNALTQISMQNLKFLDGTGLDKGDLSNVEFYRVENCPNLDAFGMLKELYYNRHLSVVELLSENITTSPCTLGSDGNWYLGSHNECHICIPLKAGDEITIEVLEAGTIPSYAFLASYKPPYSSGTSIPFASGETGRRIIEGTSVTVTAPSGTNYIAFTIIDGAGASYKYKIKTKQYVSLASTLKNIRVIGFVYDGDATDVDMVMNLAKDIAADGSTVDYTGIDSEGTPQQTLVPIIEGTLNIAGSVYADSAEFVREQYPNLVLNVTGGYYIRFADKAVQDICVANWGDGTGITTAQAAAVTSLSTKFKGNTDITEFMELGKFGVTSIVADGFNGCTNLIKADLSKISILNSQAFTNCVNFAGDGNGDLRLPSLTSIGNQAFGGYNTVQCTGLKRILDLGSITTLPDGANMYSGVFRNQINLTEVHLPETLTTIGSRCFEGCTSLEIINLSSIININEGAFNNCTSLAIIIDAPNLESLGINAFSNYNTKIGSLKGIENLGKITTIKDSDNERAGCFRNQKSLIYAKLPNTLISIGNNAFCGCTALTSVVLPSSLETIGPRAFYHCSALASMNFPSSLVTIGNYAFEECISLEGDVIVPSLTSLGTISFYKTNISSFSADILTSIPNKAYDKGVFQNCTNLRTLNLPNIITIGSNAFSECTALESVNLSLSLTNIGSYAFNNCSALANINLPASLTIIESSAFSNCTSITGIIDLPNLETLGTDVFCISDSKTGSLTGIENLGKITAINNATNGN